MRTILSLTILGLAGATATAAAAGDAKTSEETAIPFINSISNVEWKAVSNDSLYVRGGNGDWYFIRTSNRCNRLRSAHGIGFQTSALGQLDRHGAVIAQGVRCPVASIVRSEGPPRKPRRKDG
jgi:hypothetical protein